MEAGRTGFQSVIPVGWASSPSIKWDGQDETVSEFFVNPRSCHDINAETEPTGYRMPLKLAVDSKQPL